MSFAFWKTIFHSGPWWESNPGPSHPQKLPPFWARCRELWSAQVLLHLLKAWPSLVHLLMLLSIIYLIIGFWLKSSTISKKWTQTTSCLLWSNNFAGREGCLDARVIKQASVVTKTKVIMKLPQGLENLEDPGYFLLFCPLFPRKGNNAGIMSSRVHWNSDVSRKDSCESGPVPCVFTLGRSC